jgi:hypothetical protein
MIFRVEPSVGKHALLVRANLLDARDRSRSSDLGFSSAEAHPLRPTDRLGQLSDQIGRKGHGNDRGSRRLELTLELPCGSHNRKMASRTSSSSSLLEMMMRSKRPKGFSVG